MRAAKNQVRYLAAAGVLLAGTAWAGTVYRAAPAVSGPNPAQLRTLAERVGSATPEIDPLLDAAPSTGAMRISLPSVKKPSTSSGPKLNAPVLPAAGTATPAASPEPAKPAPTPEPVNPVKSIALMGVTNRGDVETAWLVNLENQERELAAVGDRAFGMTIKDIEPEQVVLTDGTEEYLLHLGEKQIPVAQAASTADSGFDGSGFDGADGTGRRRGRNGGGGWGGQGSNGSGSSGRRGSWGGGGSGGSGGWGGRSASSSSSYSGGSGGSGSSYGSSNSGNSGRRNGGYSSNSTSSGRSGGGYSGGGGGGYSGGGGGYSGRGSSGSTSQFAAGASGATSNPQTARRRGGQLTGDTPAQPSPDAISNPQTQRRIGTSSGSAFGTQQQSQNGRSSGFGNSGRTR